MDRLGRLGATVALLSITAVAAAGCGGDKTDLGEYTDGYNDRLSQNGIPAKLECPDRVDGHEGTDVECTLRATQGDKSAKIGFEIRKQGKELAVFEKDQEAIDRALQEVAGGAQQQGQQGGQQGGQGGAQPPAQGGGQQPPAQGGEQQPPAQQPPAQEPPAQGGE